MVAFVGKSIDESLLRLPGIRLVEQPMVKIGFKIKGLRRLQFRLWLARVSFSISQRFLSAGLWLATRPIKIRASRK